MLARSKEGFTAGGGAPIGRNAQHMQQGQHGYGTLRGVLFGLIVPPVTIGVLKGEQLLHQRLPGDGCSGFSYFGVASWPVEDVGQLARLSVPLQKRLGE